MVATNSSLTTGEKKKLSQHEEVIERGLHYFVDVGNALFQVQRDHLYTDVDGTFEGYCQKRWNLGKSRAYQLIESAKVVATVSTIVDTPPANEAQARVLSGLPSQQVQATVWVKAVETAPKGKDGKPKITAAHVKKVADEIAPKPPKPDKPAPVIIDVESSPVEEPAPVEITSKPSKNGSPTVDVRKFTDLEKHLGKAVRMNTDIKASCGGAEFHEKVRVNLNEALKSLAAWRKAVGAA